MRRARAGSHAAFDALVSRYRAQLYALAHNSLQDDDEAEAALREMVLSAFHDIDAFGSTCVPGTWLYLHGIRAVLKRMKVAPGRYEFEIRSEPRSNA